MGEAAGRWRLCREGCVSALWGIRLGGRYLKKKILISVLTFFTQGGKQPYCFYNIGYGN